MTDLTRSIMLKHWELANARRWEEFKTLLHSDLQYEVPQTREYIESGEGYFEMFRTWPGDWKATIKHLVCEELKAVCAIDFAVNNEVMTGISIVTLSDGKIIKLIEYWPESYEPPPRATVWLKRRPKP